MASKKAGGSSGFGIGVSGLKIKPLDADAEALIRDAEKTARRILDGEDDLAGEFDTGVACRISGCSGLIIEDVSYRYLGDPMHQIIGPGGRNQLTRIVKHYCSVCAVQYAHLPSRATKHEPLPKKKK